MILRVAPLHAQGSGWARLIVALCTVLTLAVAWSHANAAEAIDPRSGRLTLQVTDLVVPAGPVNLEWRRALIGQPGPEGLLGSAWRSNWDTRLLNAKPNFLIVDAASAVTFRPIAKGGAHVSATGERLTLGKDRRAVRTRNDGSKDMFDAQGRLIERDLRNGNKLVLRYAADGRLVRIDAPYANFLQIGTDPRGRVVSIDSSTGAAVRYAYDNDRLAEVRVNGGPSLRYAYADKGNLTRIDDPQTGAVQLAYDARGRVLSRRWADGAEERFEYDDAASRQRRVDPIGAVTVTQWRPEARRVDVTDALGSKVAIAFDGAGRPEAITGPTGETVKIVYDSLGRAAALHDPRGQVTRFEYVDSTRRLKTIARPDGTKESLVYDRQRNLTEIKLGAQTLAALAFRPDGALSAAKVLGVPQQRRTYDGQGRLQTLANPLGERWQLSYDARGNPLRAVNPLGGVTAWQWDSQDRLTSETDPVGAITRYEYDASGRLSGLIHPIGATTRFEYDARGRLVAETDPAGQVTRYEYDRAGRLVRQSEGGASESFRYDASGNLTDRVDRRGRMLKIERDLLGRVTQERASTGLQRQYRYDARGQLGVIEDPRGGKLELQRDARGQIVAMRDAFGATTLFQYDALGNVTGRRDARGQLKQFGYTGEGTLARVEEPSGDAAEYRYDAAHRLVEVVRPSGGKSRFSYNGLGQLTQEVDPLGHERRYQHDLAGRLVARTDAAGRVIRYGYDGAGRLIEKRLPNDKRIAFKYDLAGNLLEADDGAFPVRYRYDREGRPVKVEYPVIKQAIGYEYNAEGLRTKLIGPDGRVTRYEYGEHKQLAAIVPPDGKPIAFAYDAQQRLRSIRYPNGVTGTWEYDTVERVTKLAYVHGSGKPISAWTYDYDPDGNLLRQQDTEGRGTTYSYDPAGQLTQATDAAGAVRYRYGPGGRRVGVEAAAGAVTYRHDGADRLIEAGAETFAYDPNGNVVRRQGTGGATAYEFDAEDRLVRVQLADGKTTTFGYAPTGQRVWKRDPGGMTYYLHDGLDAIQELNEKGNVKAAYVHGPGIDQPLAMLRDGKTFYFHADRLGSVRALTDQSGGVATTYDYGAFGKVETRGAVSNPFTFTGREWDASTGLYYYRARYYDPALGQFLSPDPLPAALDEPLGQNPYLYVRNQPLRFVDPLGLAPNNPLEQASLDELLARKKILDDLKWRTIYARSTLLERTMLENPWPMDKGRFDRLSGMWNKLDPPLTDIKAELNRRGYTPPVPAPRTDLTPDEIDWMRRNGWGHALSPNSPSSPSSDGGASGFSGRPSAGSGVRNPTVKVAALPAGAERSPTLQVPRPNVETPEPFAPSNPLSGPIKAAGIAATIVIVIYVLDSDNPWETVKGMLPGVLRSAGIGWAFGPPGLVLDEAINAGRTIVDLVDAIATSNIPAPPLLLPVPDPVTGMMPPPPFLPRPEPQVPDYLRPGSPAPTAEQIAAAQGLAGQAGGGVPGSERLRTPTGSAQGGYLTPPTGTPGEAVPPGQSVQIPLCQVRDPATGDVITVPCPPGAAPYTPGTEVRIPLCPSKDATTGDVRMLPCPPGVRPSTLLPPGQRDRLPPDMCPVVEEAGNVQVWVPCPPGIFPGTPIPRQGPKRPGDRAGVTIAGASAPTLPVVPGTPPEGIGKTPPVTPPTTPPINPPIPPVVIGQTPPATPPTIPPRTPPATPQTPPATGAQCSAPLCLEMCQKNCESFMASYGDCSKSCLGLKSCGLSNFKLKEVKAACYLNMLTRCNQGMAGGSGGWCVKKGADASCEARAQRVCGCPVATHPQCKGEWGDG